MDGIFIEERSSWRIIHKKFGIDNRDIIEKYRMGKIDDKGFLDEDIKRWRESGIKKKSIVKTLYETPLMKGTMECIKFFRKIGKTAIISGGIDILAKRIAKFGIDYVFANGIKFKNDVPWKGILRVPIKNKDIILKKLIDKLSLKKDDIVVIGDTKYDICMFKLANICIAFNPSDEIEEHADYVIKKKDLRELIRISFKKHDTTRH